MACVSCGSPVEIMLEVKVVNGVVEVTDGKCVVSSNVQHLQRVIVVDSRNEQGSADPNRGRRLRKVPTS